MAVGAACGKHILFRLGSNQNDSCLPTALFRGFCTIKGTLVCVSISPPIIVSLFEENVLGVLMHFVKKNSGVHTRNHRKSCLRWLDRGRRPPSALRGGQHSATGARAVIGALANSSGYPDFMREVRLSRSVRAFCIYPDAR